MRSLTLSFLLALTACGGDPKPPPEVPSAERTLARALNKANIAIAQLSPRIFLSEYNPPGTPTITEAQVGQFVRRRPRIQAALRAARVVGPTLSTDGERAEFLYEGLELQFVHQGGRWYLKVQ